MLKCVIIDDEQFSVNSLSRYIEQLPDLQIVNVFTDSYLALRNLTEGEVVDIIFLDVDMPLLSGIELAKILRSKTRKLIFTTAHSKYAFDAFEVEADAFLLKPFTLSKFTITISKLFPAQETSSNGQSVGESDEYFFVKSKEDDLKIMKIRFEEVIAFESAHNYVKMHLSDDRVMTAYLTLKDINELVSGKAEFRQFHRAFIISTSHILCIERHIVQMSNKLTFNVGEQYRDDFQLFLSHKLIRTSRIK